MKNNIYIDLNWFFYGNFWVCCSPDCLTTNFLHLPSYEAVPLIFVLEFLTEIGCIWEAIVLMNWSLQGLFTALHALLLAIKAFFLINTSTSLSFIGCDFSCRSLAIILQMLIFSFCDYILSSDKSLLQKKYPGLLYSLTKTLDYCIVNCSCLHLIKLYRTH